MRILSGCQPTGSLHLGNYLGAIKQFVALQNKGECLFCVVDLHAITVKHDPANLARNTREIAAAFIASGVDADASAIFVQSHVSEHTEMAWLMNCVARMGWLERMTQFREKTGTVPPPNLREALKEAKDALADEPSSLMGSNTVMIGRADLQALYDMLAGAASNKEKASVGLYTYPVLMAADILCYKATHVPVGHDQRQHLNLARDIAEKFNHDYRRGFFPVPDALFAPTPRVMSLQDATRKMSKSDPDPRSRINLNDSDDQIAAKIRRATADVLPFPSDESQIVKPEIDNLISIYMAMTDTNKDEVLDRFGGKGYGVFKPALTDAVIATIAPIRTAMNNLLESPEYLDAVLWNGANKARMIAGVTVAETKDAMGFIAMSVGHITRAEFRPQVASGGPWDC